MAGLAPEGSQFDARDFDAKMEEFLSNYAQEFFTSYEEVYDSFDAMGLQENLLQSIYANGDVAVEVADLLSTDTQRTVAQYDKLKPVVSKIEKKKLVQKTNTHSKTNSVSRIKCFSRLC